MHPNFHHNQSLQLSLDHSTEFMIDSQNLQNTKLLQLNQQFKSKMNNPQTKLRNKPPSIKTHSQSINKPFNSVKSTNFVPTQNKVSTNLRDSTSPHSRPPLSPKQQSQIKNALYLELNTISQTSQHIKQDIILEINSVNNSDQNDHKIIEKNKGFTSSKPNTKLDSDGFEFSLGLNQKMVSLQSKSNRLIQKVLAIQQQIQKYAEVQQKQLRLIDHQSPSSPLLQTKSLLNKRFQKLELDPIQVQHQQNIRKMNILGRNKIKMIQNLELQIQNLEQKVLDPLNKTTQDIEAEKKQIDNKFINYYKHKNIILKQSKSQKFSFKNLKYLTKQIKYDKSDCGDQIIETIQAKQNQQNIQTQFKQLKEQFTSYQQRTNKQIQNYKERLNQSIVEKQILKNQFQRQKYEHLKQKIFNKNKPMKTSRIISAQKTARDFVQAKFGQRTSRQFDRAIFGFDLKFEQEKAINKVGQNIAQLINLPKTDRSINDQEPQFEDLEQFKDEVSMRYIEENQQIQGLQDKIREMDQIIDDLRNRLQKGHEHFITETDYFKSLLEEKERTLAEISDINQSKTKEIEDLKNEINDMNNYIFQSKEENQLQNQEIQEYKNLIQQFFEQVKNLRNQLCEKNALIDQLHQNIQEAEKINHLCENQIKQQQKENESLKIELQKLENQLKLKEAKQKYTEALLQKQKSKDTVESSLISQQTAKIQSQLQSQIIQNKTIKGQKQQNQQKLNLQRTQFYKVLKQKDLIIQELQQNLDQIKNQISHKVEQQVNEGIRTFLRYRKYTNHLSHQMIKIFVYGKKIYNGDEFKNVQLQINFKRTKVQNKKNIQVLGCQTDRFEGNNLSLRKLIDVRSNLRFNSSKFDGLSFKLHISLKLIQLAIDLIHRKRNSQENTSRTTKLSNNLPTLYPESIYAIESSESRQKRSHTKNTHQELSTEQKFQRLEKDFKSYHLIYFIGNKKQSEPKKDQSLVYLSPEVLLSMNESENSYCWTLGIIIDEILNNRPYYTKIDEIVTRKDNYKYQGSNLGESMASNLKEILEKMVRKNLRERPSLNVVYESFSKIIKKV